MEENLDELKNLSPEDRIRRLREIEKRDEEELEKARALIKESEEELGEAIKLQRKIPIPQMRAIDVSTLFGRGTQEDIIFAAHRFKAAPEHTEPQETSLESIVMPSAEQPTEEAGIEGPAVLETDREYRIALIKYSPAEITMERVENIKNTFKYDINIPHEQKIEMLNEIGLIATATGQKISEQYASDNPAPPAVNVLISIYQVAKDLLDKYKG